MATRLEQFGYRTDWRQISTDYYEGYRPQMTDYHMHDYYEISLILSGNVRILLSDRAQEGVGCRLVLLRPRTPHYIICRPDRLYRRQNLLFSADLLADHADDLQELLPAFGKNGTVLPLQEKEAERYLQLIKAIQGEDEPLRQKLLILYLLSLAKSQDCLAAAPTALPSFVSGALDYISAHYAEPLAAEMLAWKLHVSRTTLMTSFKKHTGSTLGEYITRYRLRRAIRLLRTGESEPEVARLCGFHDACNMIRCFKKHLGLPPRKYLSAHTASEPQETYDAEYSDK